MSPTSFKSLRTQCLRSACLFMLLFCSVAPTPVFTKESAFRNSLRWERNRLKDLGEIDGSHPGFWIITPKGRERIERISRAIHAKRISEESVKRSWVERREPHIGLYLFGDSVHEIDLERLSQKFRNGCLQMLEMGCGHVPIQEVFAFPEYVQRRDAGRSAGWPARRRLRGSLSIQSPG